MSVATVILAAGQGSRMKSDLPKVLHPLASVPLLHHAMRSGAALDPEKTVVVAGHGYDAVVAAAADFDPDAIVVRQAEQLGTGHAASTASEALSGFSGNIFVLYGDTPFISEATLAKMLAARKNGHTIVNLGFEAADPTGYGRLIVSDDGTLDAIVEHKDASEAQRDIGLCNSGVYCVDGRHLFELLSQVRSDNAQGEFYITDIVEIAKKQGLSTGVVQCPEAETRGVNSRAELAKAEAIFQERARSSAMENGATLIDPATVWFAFDTHLGRDVIVEQNVVFGPAVTVESGAHIRAFSHLEGCHISQNCIVGPYARLRPGAELSDGSKVGNFVEVKNAQIGEGAKVNHLSYVGDAEVGDAANIGAGTITCNYDGVFKHKTVIGKRAFIGSNTALVAPVRVGDDALTGSGSVITQDVPDGALVISRARQATKPGLALRLMTKLKKQKAAKAKDRNKD
jgi:bifunctional UDP-N-acetylglucosamine pyrophosphorylase/glucosamine-1-phosphate N-acetyltransferase